MLTGCRAKTIRHSYSPRAPSIRSRMMSARPVWRALVRIGAGLMLAAARLDHQGARCRRDIGDAVGMEYVSRVPRPPLDGLIDDLYYLEGAPPYARLTLPPMPGAFLIVNLGRRSASAPAPTSRRPSTPTAAWSPCRPARWSSATHSGPVPSACTSSRGGWRRFCRCPRPSCVTGR